VYFYSIINHSDNIIFLLDEVLKVKRKKPPVSAKDNAVIARKRARALDLREQGYTYLQIAEAIGWKSQELACYHVKKAIAEIIEEPAKAVLALEKKRLDKILNRLSISIEKIHASIVASDIVDKDNISSLTKLISSYLSAMERRAKYEGLDKPAKMALTDPTGEHEYDKLTDAERVARITALVTEAQKKRAGYLANKSKRELVQAGGDKRSSAV